MARRRAGFVALCLATTAVAWPPAAAASCTGTPQVHAATRASVQAFIKARQRQVLTFAGYSGAGYQDPAAMLAQAGRILDTHRPDRVLVNVGATAQGIGAVYELARQRGFTTIGIVSSLARDENVALSPCVDHVFFIADRSWGGLLPGTRRLSPTLRAVVAASSSIVAIGGGEIARDEGLAARRLGKPVTFFPADMNHEATRAKARQRGQPEPQDFRGAAHAALSR